MVAAWLEARLDASPAPLQDRLRSVVAAIDPGLELCDALLAAARATLDDVRSRVESREAALDLLVADGLLTLACEAAAYSHPESLAGRCEAMGPGGELGRMAVRWAGRG
jgi:hypothetical protein